MNTSLPLKIEKGKGLKKESDVKESVRSFLELLVSCPVGSCEADPEFGFVFKNFRFENFNEDKGVLYSPNPDGEVSDFYKYKIHGRGVNLNTFAHELKCSIAKYEPRLREPWVNMEYKSLEKTIVFTIRGIIGDTMTEKFEHKIKMHVW